jgi:hypothetical protein
MTVLTAAVIMRVGVPPVTVLYMYTLFPDGAVVP